MRTGLYRDRLPMRDEIRRAAVDLEPRQRLGEDVSVGERFLRARSGLDVVETSLQTENLPQTFDVPPRERQVTEARSQSDWSDCPQTGLTALRLV